MAGMAPGAAAIHSWLSGPSMAKPSSSATAAALALKLPSCSERTRAEMPPAATKADLWQATTFLNFTSCIATGQHTYSIRQG